MNIYTEAIATKQITCVEVFDWFWKQSSPEQAEFLALLLNWARSFVGVASHDLQMSYIVDEVLKARQLVECANLIDFAQNLSNKSECEKG